MSDPEGPHGGHGPAVVGGPGAHHDGSGPPPRSPARFLGYVLIFVILVAVSLYLRAQHNKNNAASGGATGPPATQASGLAVVDTAWVGQACKNNTPSGGYTLRAGYDSTEGTVNAWISELSSGAVTETMTEGSPNLETAVCYIDGPWQLPQSAQSTVPTDTLLRAIVLVPKGGTAVSGPIGPATSLALARPVPPTAVPSPPPAVTATPG